LSTEFDAKTIFQLKLNIERTFRRANINGSDVVTWKTNGQSFRGNELRANADIRIVVYRGSRCEFTAAVRVAQANPLRYGDGVITESHSKESCGRFMTTPNAISRSGFPSALRQQAHHCDESR
jgi:hypothetical protein